MITSMKQDRNATSSNFISSPAFHSVFPPAFLSFQKTITTFLASAFLIFAGDISVSSVTLSTIGEQNGQKIRGRRIQPVPSKMTDPSSGKTQTTLDNKHRVDLFISPVATRQPWTSTKVWTDGHSGSGPAAIEGSNTYETFMI